MMLGLLKLMRRLILAGYQTESQLFSRLILSLAMVWSQQKLDVTHLSLRIFTSATSMGA
jgi:hypothetical protein